MTAAAQGAPTGRVTQFLSRAPVVVFSLYAIAAALYPTACIAESAVKLATVSTSRDSARAAVGVQWFEHGTAPRCGNVRIVTKVDKHNVFKLMRATFGA